jgi:hypothetical protein
MYAKLFSSIIHSTVWRELPHVKILWITMLAMADKDGVVMASIPGLADAARVTMEQCHNGLQRLQEPDQYSRTKDNEGRRIIEIDGGWALLNYAKYRDLKSETENKEKNRVKVANWRAKQKGNVTKHVTESNSCDQVLPDVTPSNPLQMHTTDTEKSTDVPPSSEQQTKKPLKVKTSKAKVAKPEEETLDAILGGRDSQNCVRFWKFAGIWPKDRNPGPRSLAKAWNVACALDEPVNIYHGALNYRDGFLPPKREKDETQFMKAPLTWLQEEGWRAQLEAKEVVNA